MTLRPRADPGLPQWAILWAPLAVLGLQLAVRVADGDGTGYRRYIESELGLIENLTALLLLPAVVAGAAAARAHAAAGRGHAALWYAGASVLALVFAGEELSWGQHWFGWESPAFFAEHNRQGETNLHNLDLQLGRVVKSLLTAAVVGGGLVLPLWRRRVGGAAGILEPPAACVPVAVLVLVTRLVERLITWLDLRQAAGLDVNLKETNELYLAWFIALYLWAARNRVVGAGAAAR